MDNRQLLLNLISGGDASSHKYRFWQLLNGEKTLVFEEDIDGDRDFDMVYQCQDEKSTCEALKKEIDDDKDRIEQYGQQRITLASD